jgi:cyclophilin family peptidyl-prolyl cis-trans isomerase
MNKYLVLITFLFVSWDGSSAPTQKDFVVKIKTPQGTMYAILYDQTPLHKANFLKLAQKKFYNGLLFHRVIPNFMIQGGDPKSRTAKKGASLGDDELDYKIPAEIHRSLFHQKGALAAARDNNPKKESSASQFYIVQGKPLSDAEFNQYKNLQLTKEQREVYKKIGGSPHLDGGYTVFGQVIEGLSTIDKIASQPRDQRDQPAKDVRMKVSIKKMTRTKISKKYGYSFALN